MSNIKIYACVGLSCLSLSHAAFAQSAVEAPVTGDIARDSLPASAPPAPTEGAIAGATSDADIVVTAQRRNQRLVDVPATITAVSDTALATAGTDSILSLNKLVPSVYLTPQVAYLSPVVRGVGAPISLDLESAVAIYVDGVYQPTASSNIFDLSSVTGVQVLKGPQGTLFGRNATGGAFQITTADPSFVNSGKFEVQFGRFNDLRTTAYLNAGLNDVVAINAAVAYRYSDGYIRDLRTNATLNPSRTFVGRAKLLFEPTDTLKFILTAAHNEFDDPTLAYRLAYKGRTIFAANPAAGPIATRRGTASHNVDNVVKTKADEYNLRAYWDLGFGTLGSITALKNDSLRFNYDRDYTYLPAVALNALYKTRAFSQETTLTGPSNKDYSYVVGAYYFNNRTHYPLFNANNVPFLHDRKRLEALAGFVDATYKFGDLSVIGGLRYSTEVRRQRNGPSANFIATDHIARVRESAWTPRAGLSYALAARTNVYATYSRGFKSGVFGTTDFAGTGTRPETVDAYEIGFKHASSFFDVSLSAYRQDYSDVQTNIFVIRNSVLVNQLLNAASARIYGTELESNFRFSPRFSVRLAGAYNHADYRSFTSAPTYVPAGLGFAPAIIDASGNPVTNTPRVTANASINYKLPTSLGDVTFNLSPSYTSRVYFNFASDLNQSPVFILDGSILLAADDGLSLRVYARNIFNRTYALALARVQTDENVTWSQPPTYGLALGYSF